MSNQNPVVALLVRELLPITIIVAVATAGQRLTHYLFTRTK
jgi:hypothetical protein